MDKCTHENLRDYPYVDYDRNMHLVRCLDCGEEWDLGYFEFQKFMEDRSEPYV
jgi:hypothetical protein